MMQTGKSAGEFLTAEDLEGFDPSKLPELCAQVISENEKSVSDFKNGKDKAVKALVGGVMRLSKGRADARAAEEVLRSMLSQ